MPKSVAMAFEEAGVRLRRSDILPVKQVPSSVKKSMKYNQIAASVREIGIIEPLIVARQNGRSGTFLLLDGHLRIEILKDLNIDEVDCLVATDDEAFTYNKRVNRLATIQEHKMILKAVERGVPEDRIAAALNVNVKSIRAKRQLLVGICPEAAELLKDKHCPLNSFRSLKKMKPLRQVEVAELMIAMNNYSVDYSKALLAATPQNQLIAPEKGKNFKGVSQERIDVMEREMESLQREMKLVEASYGPDHLNLVLATGYLVSILKNENVERYLDRYHGEILGEFHKLADAASIGFDAAQ